ncbi:MAG: ubiquinol-cytochrome c reductase iron-sulfur subunit [Syntrophobacter sp.]
MDQKDKLPPKNAGRRGLLSVLGWTFLALASAGVSWVVGRFLAGNQNHMGSEPSRFGTPGDYPLGTVTKKGKVVLFRDKAGFWAVTTVCTHLGCQPVFVQQQNMFVCPCHGSRFDAEGRVLSGPATENMALATLRVDDQGILVAYPKEKVKSGYRFTT